MGEIFRHNWEDSQGNWSELVVSFDDETKRIDGITCSLSPGVTLHFTLKNDSLTIVDRLFWGAVESKFHPIRGEYYATWVEDNHGGYWWFPEYLKYRFVISKDT